MFELPLLGELSSYWQRMLVLVLLALLPGLAIEGRADIAACTDDMLILQISISTLTQ